MKEGGINNLSWVATYTEQSQSANTDEQKAETGYYTMAKILEREGIHPYKKLQEIVLEAMRIENYKEHNIEYKDIKKDLIKHVPNCPELTKYFFVFGTSTNTTSQSKTGTMEIKTTGLKMANVQKALCGDAGSPSSVVKIENPEKLRAGQLVAILTNGKAAVQRALDPIKDGLSQLQHSKKYKDFIDEGKAVLETANKFVDNARDKISSHLVMQADESKDESEWQQFADKQVQPLIDVCTTHVDGLKHFKQRMTALL